MKRLKQLFWISKDNGEYAPLTSKKKVSRPAALLNLLLVTVLWVALFWLSLRAIHVQLDFVSAYGTVFLSHSALACAVWS